MQSHTYANRKISDWLNEAKHKTGYLGVGSNNPHDELTADELKRYREKKDMTVLKEWQFHIAILPTKENLSKAMFAIAELFDQKKYDFVFRVLSLNNNECNWDGALFDPKKEPAPSDRDQRGKEMSVSMRFNPKTQSFECTPEQWKTVMLECWQALVKHQVEGIGYAHTPFGDKAVMAESDCTTPFSYAAYKQDAERHGILYQTAYNPNTHRDPLARVVISKADLAKYDLLKQADEMHALRASSILQHSTNTAKLLTAQFKAIHDAKAIPALDIQLKRLRDDVYKNKTVDYHVFEKLIEAIDALVPHIERAQLISRYHHELYPLLDKVKKNQLTPHVRENLKNIMMEIAKYRKESLSKHIQAIQQDFKSIQSKIPDLITGIDLDQLIIKSPVQMQYLFRQCMHYIREKEAFTMFYHPKEPHDAKEQATSLESMIKRANISVTKSGCLYQLLDNIPDTEQWHRFQQHTELLRLQLESCKKQGLFHREETGHLLKIYSQYEKIVEAVEKSSLEERAKAERFKL